MYYCYLGKILLPIMPAKITTKIKSKNKTVDLASGGEINILKTPGLTEISFDALIPTVKYSFSMYEDGFKSPNFYMEHFEKLSTGKQAFEFTIIRPTAEMLLEAAAENITLPGEDSQYDVDGDGRITAADARIILRSRDRIAVLNNTKIRCALEDYTITEDAGKHGRDFLVNLKLKKCPEYSLKTVGYSTR